MVPGAGAGWPLLPVLRPVQKAQQAEAPHHASHRKTEVEQGTVIFHISGETADELIEMLEREPKTLERLAEFLKVTENFFDN